MLLLFALCALALAFVVLAVRARPARVAGERRWPSLVELAIGFVTDFLDTLGIGSFAVTTALFRIARTLPDRLLPGTLNVGHALPTVLQALIYISVIEVDVRTLIALIAASMFGAYFGAGVVARLSE